MERLVGAFNLAAKSMGYTTQELNKQLKMGNVLAKDLLPKLTPMISEMAHANGALAKQLESTRVAERRLALQAQDSAKTIFDSGFSEGLKELYETLTNMLKNSDKELKKLGDVFGKVFKGIAYVLKIIEPLMKAFINNIELIAGAAAINGIYKLSQGFKFLGMSIRGAFLPLAIGIGLMEEFASLMSDDIVGFIEKQAGFQINLQDKTTSELYRKDGTLFSKEAKPIAEGWSDLLSGMEKVSTYGNLLTAIPAMQGNINSWFATDKPQLAPVTNNITNNVTVQASSEDQILNVVNRHMSPTGR